MIESKLNKSSPEGVIANLKTVIDERLLKEFNKLCLSLCVENDTGCDKSRESNIKIEKTNCNFLKSILVKDKKNGKIFLIISMNATKIDLALLGKEIGCSNLRCCSDNDLNNFGLTKNFVSPFLIINDIQNKVTIIIDKIIKCDPSVEIHFSHGNASLFMSFDDLVKYLNHYNHAPVWFDSSTKKNDEKSQKSDTVLIGITEKKSQNFPEWYIQVILRAELIDYHDISGFYILRSYGFHIWEFVQRFFDDSIKKMGVENCYFPLLINAKHLEKEKSHIEGFSPEVCWITECGQTKLDSRIAVRPTSETVMYPTMAKWVHSHRDLPLKCNMWNSVIRWEFKQATPFIRSREFLWQEGHTAHQNKEEALDMVLTILDLYRRWYEDYLAVSVIKGWKSENEKFGGADKTSTIECFIPENGRGIQAATSHLLGTNFSKIFDFTFLDEKNQAQFVWQTSWGCTTRSIGVMVMTHSDDSGLVLPPNVAIYQVVMIPIWYKHDESVEILKMCELVESYLNKVSVRVKVDKRDNYKPGWKYNHWELKGVPIRIEIGMKEVKNETVRVVQRWDGKKFDLLLSEISFKIPSILNEIQRNLLENSRVNLNKSIVKVYEVTEAVKVILDKKMFLTPWCDEAEKELELREKIQGLLFEAQKSEKNLAESEESKEHNVVGGVKIICIPFDQPDIKGKKCLYTGKDAVCWALWGRTY